MKEIKILQKKLKQERKKRNLSRKELAKMSGVSVYTVINIEIGRSGDDILLGTVLKLAKALDLSILDLIS